MKRLFIPLMLAVFVSGCAISREGAEVAGQPPAVQGTNDVQGAPIYSGTGSSIGVGVGKVGRGAGAGIGIGF